MSLPLHRGTSSNDMCRNKDLGSGKFLYFARWMQDGEFSGLLRPVVEHVQPRCQPLRRLRRGWRRRGPRLPDISLRR